MHPRAQGASGPLGAALICAGARALSRSLYWRSEGSTVAVERRPEARSLRRSGAPREDDRSSSSSLASSV